MPPTWRWCAWWDQQEVALAGHALAKTYAVLPRLPGDLRLTPSDAAGLLAERFAPRLSWARRQPAGRPCC